MTFQNKQAHCTTPTKDNLNAQEILWYWYHDDKEHNWFNGIVWDFVWKHESLSWRKYVLFMTSILGIKRQELEQFRTFLETAGNIHELRQFLFI